MFRCAVLVGFTIAVLLPPAAVAQQPAAQTADATASGQEGASSAGEAQGHRMKMGGEIMAKSLLSRVPPDYPADAFAAKISGTVVFHAIIATDGSVKDVRVVSGPPQLVDAATNAVKQWKYRPFSLNGEPVEIDTTISVVFNLADPAGTGKVIDPQLRADIVHMFLDMRGSNTAEAAFEEQFGQARREIESSPWIGSDRQKIMQAWTGEFFTTIRNPAFMDGIVAIYAKHFSDEDIKAIDEFLQTPAGQHFVMESQEINDESAALGRQFATDHLPGAISEMCEAFPELQADEKICPRGSTGTQSPMPPPIHPSQPPSSSENK